MKARLTIFVGLLLSGCILPTPNYVQVANVDSSQTIINHIGVALTSAMPAATDDPVPAAGLVSLTSSSSASLVALLPSSTPTPPDVMTPAPTTIPTTAPTSSSVITTAVHTLAPTPTPTRTASSYYVHMTAD